MKKLILLLFALLTGFAVINSCGKKSTTPEAQEKKPINPNGDSELAIVMRTMMSSGKTMKQEILDGKEVSAYPEAIKTITTAAPTDGMIEDRNIFNGLAKHYLLTLDSVYQPAVNKTVQFNRVVNSCVNCHQSYCQGPIPAIKQLYIPTK